MNPISFEQLPEAISRLIAKVDLLEKLLRETNNAQPIESEKLLSVEEASEFLSLKVPTIYSKVSRGELPVMKRSKRLYFSQKELLDYLKAGSKRTYSELQNEADNYLKNKGKI
jgi:excisionase family DNA binding protein